MAMINEAPAAKLKFNAQLLLAIAPTINRALSHAVWKPGMYCLNLESKLVADHSKQIDDSLFIDGRVSQPSKIYGRAILNPFVQGSSCDPKDGSPVMN